MQINVVEYFLETEQRHPLRAAVVSGESGWTFHELGLRARAIARRITALKPSRSAPIAVYLPKSKEAIASFLGIAFSGNCYAPLDIKMPAARLEITLRNLQPALLLTSEDLKARLVESGVEPSRLLILDEISGEDGPAPEAWRETIDTDPLYILHTSGSTGQPKGVVIAHRSVIDYIDWARKCFGIDEHTVIGNQAPLIFDNSTLDIYLCLACGASLHLIPEDLFLFPVRLMEYLAKHAVSFVFWVPSVLVNVAKAQILDRISGLCLQKILFAGEVMPARHLNMWRERFPSALFANLYGPTEITVDCTYYVVEGHLSDDDPVPIGRACRNTGILILSEDNRKCGVNEQGELCVRGSSLALGYWNQPIQTAAAFVQNPLNPHYPELIYRTGDLVYQNQTGEIIFVGRKDSQIKHMGYRIELGEVENSALQVAGVQNACVLYHSLRKEIVLFYEGATDLDASGVRNELSRRLPKYMWPRVVQRVDELPRNPSGKIDRKQLTTQYAS